LTPEGFATFVQTLGLPLALLIVVLWTGARGLWVFGKTHNELLEDRNYWRDLALKGTDLADKAVSQRTRRGVRP
jgi:hypothetical protein